MGVSLKRKGFLKGAAASDQYINSNSPELFYQINEKPRSVKDGIIYGIQNVVTMFGPMTITPLALAAAMRMTALETSILLSLCMIGSGIATLCQTTWGVRLPVVQTMSLAFMAGYISISGIVSVENGGVIDIPLTMCYVTGAIMLGGLLEFLLGVTNAISKLKRVFTPVIMGPVMMLIMLSMAETTVRWAGENWLVFAVVAVSTLTMSNVIPETKWGKDKKVLRSISILVPLALGYVLSLVLSRTGYISPESSAYVNLDVVKEAPWFTTPGALIVWGVPKFRIDFLLLVLAGYLMSMIESIGQYHANTFACRCEGKLSHKRISMGIGMEGLGCILSGFAGGLASTSAGENIGLVERTRVASRYIARIAGVILILLGLVGKVGAFITTLTSPIIAGIFVSILGVVGGGGIQTTFSKCPLNGRNVSIFGIALIFGMGMPAYIAGHQVETGILWLNNSINGICSSNMAIGGIMAILLDQFLPGTDQERGIETFDAELMTEEKEAKPVKDAKLRPEAGVAASIQTDE